MFDRIRRRISGTADPKTAYRQGATCFDNLCINFRSKMGDDTPFINFFEDQKFRASFYTFLGKVCHDCLTADDRDKQLVNLRKEIVTCADEKLISEAYLSMPDNDREILSDRIFTKQTR